jgi:hypothetical protein
MPNQTDLEKQLTANQLFKQYKTEGGTLGFSDWLTREKAKGVFPINADLNKEIQDTLTETKKTDMNKTILGFPTKTLVMVGVIIVGAVVISQLIKKKQ